MWKDGGPIIGMQLENEYNLTGPGQGREHIAALKRIALAAGLDVPLYTVTGWDNTVFPHHEVTPVFGGYADEPWGLSTEKLPPSEVYAFRFDSRVRGNLGAETVNTSPGDADADIAHTPFLGAEFGGGVPTMYRRRPIMQPDDIAAMLPVELGSGVNLYGYYMFHGGQNSPDHGSLEENTSIGAYNDLPMIDYDFQAPLGAYGQQHAVMNKLRPFHYFLQSFGADLAPMTVHRPDVAARRAAAISRRRAFRCAASATAASCSSSNHVRQYRNGAAEGRPVRRAPAGRDGHVSEPADRHPIGGLFHLADQHGFAGRKAGLRDGATADAIAGRKHPRLRLPCHGRHSGRACLGRGHGCACGIRRGFARSVDKPLHAFRLAPWNRRCGRRQDIRRNDTASCADAGRSGARRRSPNSTAKPAWCGRMRRR